MARWINEIKISQHSKCVKPTGNASFVIRGSASDDAATVAVDFDKLGIDKRERAEKIHPLRMAVIQCAFPFKEQMDNFRNRLRKDSFGELFADKQIKIRFEGFLVQRQVIAYDPAAGQVLNSTSELTKQSETLRSQVEKFLAAVKAA